MIGAANGFSASEEPLAFVRSATEDGIVAFETGVRTYRPASGVGPSVTLVGVVHIGDKRYYEELVAILDTHALVMFESVLPRGAFGTHGADDAERQRRSQDAMLFLRGLICDFVVAKDQLPASLDELRAFAVGRDSRLARPIDLASSDGWERPLSYAKAEPSGFQLTSLGRDGAPGGRGADLDLVLRRFSEKELARIDSARTASKDESPRRDLYGELAAALGTDLQVRSIDYDREHWVPADLPMEELLDRLWIRGERSATIEMISNPSGFQQGLLRFLLSLVSKSPGFKKTVIEALGSAGANTRRTGLSAVDSRIILDERNEAVVEQLRRVLAAPVPPASIAIFYGAAHMPDFESTLRRDFALVPGDLKWHRAMYADDWTLKRVRTLRERLASERTAIEKSDPSGYLPGALRLENRIRRLDERIAERTAPGGASGG